MSKRLSLFVAALAASAALAIPAAASATPRLYEGSTALKAGTDFVLTSDDVQITNTPFGTIECQMWESIELLQDNSTEFGVEADATDGEATGCFEGSVTEPSLGTIFMSGSDKGSVLGLGFSIDVGPFECTYLTPITGFSYTTGTDVITFGGSALITPTEVCEPPSGSPVFEGSFTATTTKGAAITIKNG